MECLLAAVLAIFSCQSIFIHQSQPDSLQTECVPVPDGGHPDGIQPLSAEVTEFVRGLALLLLPERFSDTDDWGKQTRMQSGLNVDLQPGRVRTSRRWKDVNHGLWRRAEGYLREPADRFQLSIWVLPKNETGHSRYGIQASAAIRATGRQQQWSYGVLLWSLSADADVDVRLNAVLEVQQEIGLSEGRPVWKLYPRIESAELGITRYSLRRISHSKGAGVREGTSANRYTQ